MRPLLVAHSDLAGGAARAAYRIHTALRAEGIGSTLAVRRKLSDDETVYRMRAPDWGRFGPRLEAYIQRLQRTENPVIHSANFLPTRWSSCLEGDVVNLHWIGAGTMSIEDVGRIAKPVVVTLHDMWGFCGSEHYAPDCADARWVVGYTRDNRPVGHRGLDLDRWTWERKRRNWSRMTVVAPSRWLADCARRSSLMAGWPVHVVPNPLDVTVFRPLDRVDARRALELPTDGKVVLFGAVRGRSDHRKGFDLLLGALRKLQQSERTVGVIFGEGEPSTPLNLDLPLRWMGPVKDDSTLVSLYSAADVMVVPSRQEAFGQTASEAQACGTPVVAFQATGLMDVVEHGITGCLVEPFKTDALANAISWVLEDGHHRAALGHAARERAVRLWSPSVVAKQYREVYETVIYG